MKSFPDPARIEEVRRLKKEGLSMTQIIDRLEGSTAPAQAPAQAVGSFDAPLHLTLDEIRHPAYMINYSFELMWINPAGQHALFHDHL